MATLHYVIYPANMSAPSAVQVSQGRNSSGANATASGNTTARTTTGQQVFSVPATGLSDNTSYRVAFVWTDGSSFSNVDVSSVWRTGALFSKNLQGTATVTARLLTAAGGMLLQNELVVTTTLTGSLLTGIRFAANLDVVGSIEVGFRDPVELSGNLGVVGGLSGRLFSDVRPGRGVIVPPDIIRVVVDVWDEEQS